MPTISIACAAISNSRAGHVASEPSLGYPDAMAGLRINRTIVIPDDELIERFVRSAGPGGQNVNKVASKAELRWRIRDTGALSEDDHAWLLDKLAARITRAGYLVVTSTATRDQARNRADARRLLAEMIRKALVRPKKRVATRPSRRSVERRLQAKKRRARIKQDRSGEFD